VKCDKGTSGEGVHPQSSVLLRLIHRPVRTKLLTNSVHVVKISTNCTSFDALLIDA